MDLLQMARDYYRWSCWAIDRARIGLAKEAASQYSFTHGLTYQLFSHPTSDDEKERLYEALLEAVAIEEYMLTRARACKRMGAFTLISNGAFRGVVANVSMCLRRCGIASVDIRRIIMDRVFPLRATGEERTVAFLKPFALLQRFPFYVNAQLFYKPSIVCEADEDERPEPPVIKRNRGEMAPHVWDHELYELVEPFTRWGSKRRRIY